MNKQLSIRQERFCEGIVVGMTGTKAYINAGAKVSAAVAKVGASKWLTKANIKAHIAELRKPQTKNALLTKDRQRALLMAVAESGSEKTQNRLRAIEIDAKLAGFFSPERVEVESGPKTLDEIRARANAVASGLDLIARREAAKAREASASANGHSNGNGHAPFTPGLSRWNPK